LHLISLTNFAQKPDEADTANSGQKSYPDTSAIVLTTSTTSTPPAVKVASSAELELSRLTEARMREELLRKQKELIERQQKKLELELLQAKAQLEEQQRQTEVVAAAMADPARAQQVRRQ
jgi:hypothetical protein